MPKRIATRANQFGVLLQVPRTVEKNVGAGSLKTAHFEIVRKARAIVAQQIGKLGAVVAGIEERVGPIIRRIPARQVVDKRFEARGSDLRVAMPIPVGIKQRMGAITPRA